VHTSDIVTQAAAVEYERCKDPCQAVRRVMTRAPSEAIFAFVFRDQAERIFVANVNQRLVIGRDDAGTYLASSAIALPDDVRWRTEMPANTIAVIGADGLSLECLARTGELPVDEALPAGLETAFLDFVRANPGSALGHVTGKALRPLLPEDALIRGSLAAYQTVERLLAAGLVRSETETVPGVNGQGTAPRTVWFVSASSQPRVSKE